MDFLPFPPLDSYRVFCLPLSYIKRFSAMEWVLLLDELPGKMVGPTLIGASAWEQPEFIKQNLSVEYVQWAGHRG